MLALTSVLTEIAFSINVFAVSMTNCCPISEDTSGFSVFREKALIAYCSAFSVFANDGVKNNYRNILKIENSDGKIIFEAQNSPAEVI